MHLAPPEEPEVPVHPRTWEYFVVVGNEWWTTLFAGVWHGSAYTRTVKRLASESTNVPWDWNFEPWIVPYLYASVAPRVDSLGQDRCGEIGDSDEDYNDSDVEVGSTEPYLAPYPKGVYSRHSAGGLNAEYCRNWDWT